MWILILGCLLFFGVHSLAMVYPALCERFTARYGANPWQGLYSLIAAIGLALMVYGYGAARVDSAWLYTPPTWSRHTRRANRTHREWTCASHRKRSSCLAE